MEKGNQIRKSLDDLRLRIADVEMWMTEAMGLVYQIEDALLDLEDKEISQKYDYECNIDFLKEAAAGMNRLNMSFNG